MTDLYELGRRIYDARLAADKTLTDVADAVGVAPSTIQRYEQGKINRIKLPVVESIAKVLGVDPSWLLQKESSPLPSNISPMPGPTPSPCWERSPAASPSSPWRTQTRPWMSPVGYMLILRSSARATA